MKLKMLTSYNIGLGVMYRYKEQRWPLGCDEFDNSYGHRLSIEITEYSITKRTAKGVWIDDFGKARFIRNDSRKRFACETKELSKEQFKHRKLAQRRILQAQLGDVDEALRLIECGDVSNDLAIRLEPPTKPNH